MQEERTTYRNKHTCKERKWTVIRFTDRFGDGSVLKGTGISPYMKSKSNLGFSSEGNSELERFSTASLPAQSWPPPLACAWAQSPRLSSAPQLGTAPASLSAHTPQSSASAGSSPPSAPAS